MATYDRRRPQNRRRSTDRVRDREDSPVIPSFDGTPPEDAAPSTLPASADILPGSDGEPPEPQAIIAPSGGAIFRGELSVENGIVFLSSGGIRARVTTAAPGADPDPAVDVRAFSSARGIVTIRGQQQDGTIYVASLVSGAAKARGDDGKLAEVAAAAEQHRDALMQCPGVVAVRGGYRFRNGWITNEPAIVVSVMKKSDRASLPDGTALPAKIGPYPVDVAPATPLEQLLATDRETAMRVISASNVAREEYLLTAPEEESAELAEAARTDHYVPPADVSLDEVTDAMNVLCHTSPDAGWPTLQPFFQRVQSELTVAMYDFTAPHLLTGLQNALRSASAGLNLILDPGLSLSAVGNDADNPKAGDLTEDSVVRSLQKKLSSKFDFVWAAVKRAGKTTAGIFPSAYHIKVAVADDDSFWLSSGNWQSSNQPDLDPLNDNGVDPNTLHEYNREWHVVVDHPGLASMYRRFIEWDVSQATPLQAAPEVAELPPLFVDEALFAEAAFQPRYFQPQLVKATSSRPIRVQPLLTPDNYADMVLPIIQSAQTTLYFQNQYINIGKTVEDRFRELLDTLVEKMNDGVDVRIILRDLPKARTMLTNLQNAGFDMSKVRLQPQCHTKGIVVDSTVVVVGSHNWSNEGALHNRDASLIFHDERVAKFYEQIFLWDWANLARQQTAFETSMPSIAGGREAAPLNAITVPWSTIFED